jgi:hypothetical protein
VPDECDLLTGGSLDCNDNSIPDACDIESGSSADCNGNGIPDECDISGGSSVDCNDNGLPDECEQDCNCNGTGDAEEIDSGLAEDCDADGVPDDCQVSNDECGTALTMVGDQVEFSTCGASSGGPEEPPCAGQSILNDVWVRFLSSCAGELTVGIDADFDAIVAVYGSVCPGDASAAIACGAGGVSFEASSGVLYRLRIGSADGSTGSGTLTLSCE